MAMELMKQPASMDFKFESASTSPYISAPSSPQRFGSFFYSAPASPRVYASEDGGGGDASVPFNWEEKPGIRYKSTEEQISTAASSNYGDADQDLEEINFAFDFSGNLERLSLSADELFDGGKIKPLKPPPRFHYEVQNYQWPTLDTPESPKKTSRQAFSPRDRRKDSDLDPFAAALEETRKRNFQESYTRGRERSNDSSQSSRHKATRSLSPFRVSDLLFDPEFNQEPTENPSSLSGFSSFWHKKWKIKDLLLFRSASESHATDHKEQMRKYSALKKTDSLDVKNSSFRSTDSSSGSVSRRRRSGPPISAHEFHYTVNRAVSEEMKKRTFLPYKQGLLGCLGFQPSLFSSDAKKF